MKTELKLEKKKKETVPASPRNYYLKTLVSPASSCKYQKRMDNKGSIDIKTISLKNILYKKMPKTKNPNKSMK